MLQLSTSSTVAASARPITAVVTRSVDLIVALLLLLLASPLLLWHSVRSPYQAFRCKRMLGRARRPFTFWRCARSRAASDLATLVNVLNGSMSFAGPRPVAADDDLSAVADSHFVLRPGIFSVAATRTNMGLEFEDEKRLDEELLAGWGLKAYLSLITKGLMACLLNGHVPRVSPQQFRLFGVRIDNWTMENSLDWVLHSTDDKSRRLRFAFVNPDCLNTAYHHQGYRAALDAMDCVFPDGSGIRLACRLVGINQRANVNGTDMFPLLCERMAVTGQSLFLLGARPGIADAVADNMRARYPGLNIAGTQDGYFDAADTDDVIVTINQSGASVLLVAFGAPRQELWLHEHASALTVPVAAGVGGLFDFYSGRIPRAPLWMRETGLEWIWRLTQEPRRMWRRYVLGNPLFVMRVIKQCMNKRV